MTNFQRDIAKLETNASKWWPESLIQSNAEISIVPKLLKTQDDFIALLQLCKKNPRQIFQFAKYVGFPANLLIKHLVVITDYGGEAIQRLGRDFAKIFHERTKSDRPKMGFIWEGKPCQYVFKAVSHSQLNNSGLHIDGKGLLKPQPFDNLKCDITMILLYAGSSYASNTAGLEVCNLGSLLGNREALEKYIKERYIIVSRITGGAKANSLGQFAQQYLKDFLTNKLGNQFEVRSNTDINIGGSASLPFDLLVSKNNKSIGIEVSFQVTTNSTIERKANEAQNRINKMHSMGNKVAYVIDGAGNFQRSSAITKICNNSDCTVAYSDSEFDILVDFIRQELP